MTDDLKGSKNLGRLPRKSDTRALLFSHFTKKALPEPPLKTNFWPKRKAFALRSFGNTYWGDCTRAKQAIASMRMERLETRRTPEIDDDEVIKVYFQMTDRLYGGGDTGAYETDALSEWRKPDLTFQDKKGRPLTIDAFVRLNPADQLEMRRALSAAGAHGIAICLNLPEMFMRVDPPQDWGIPDAVPLIGDWLPGSAGGHSMWATDYDEKGLWLEHTWLIPRQRITWEAAAVYLDEAHLCIDSMDFWKKHKPEASKILNLPAIKEEVNAVSSQKIR